MKESTKELVKYRLERSYQSLNDANILFREGSLYSAVNRLYYAMFYSVNALLLTKDLSSSKHSGVRALFNKEFVNLGLIDKEDGRFYSEIFERRQKGDYEDLVEFDKEDVEQWLKRAEEFIEKIKKLTLKIIAEEKVEKAINAFWPEK